MTLQAIVDRIEGELAVLELSGDLVEWPVRALPQGIKEGDRVSLTLEVLPPTPGDGAKRLERLRKRSGSGDIAL